MCWGLGGGILPSEVLTAVKRQIRASLCLSPWSDLSPRLLRGSK